MSGKIFINYRRDEGGGYAHALYSKLVHTFEREQLFMDVDNIAPGIDFVSFLDEQVAECDVVLVLMGRGWIDATDETGSPRLDNAHDFVRIEIASALSHGKLVVPVLLGDAIMPRADQLPEQIQSLTRRQAFRLRHETFSRDATKLAEELTVALELVENTRQIEEARQRAVYANTRQKNEQRKSDQFRREKPSSLDPLRRTWSVRAAIMITLVASGIGAAIYLTFTSAEIDNAVSPQKIAYDEKVLSRQPTQSANQATTKNGENGADLKDPKQNIAEPNERDVKQPVDAHTETASIEPKQPVQGDDDAKSVQPKLTASTLVVDPSAEELDLGFSPDDRLATQWVLTKLGFDTKGVDGVFGSNTRRAISDFQISRGLQPSGFLDKATHAALKRDGAQELDTFDAEDFEWQKVRNTTNANDLKQYIQHFPSGRYVDLARSKQQIFVLNNIDLTPDGMKIVKSVADTLKTYEFDSIQVIGHTDTVGTRAFNIKRGQRHADLVANALVEFEIPADQLDVKSRGETGLLVPTADEVAEPLNRRAEIVVRGMERKLPNRYLVFFDFAGV